MTLSDFFLEPDYIEQRLRVGFIEEKLHAALLATYVRLCIDAVVVNQRGEVLGLQRNVAPARDTIWFPGGKMIRGKNNFQSITDHVREDCGLTVTEAHTLGVARTYFSTAPRQTTNGLDTINVVVYVKAEGDLNLSTDHHSGNWFNFEELAANKEGLHPYILAYLTAAFQYRNTGILTPIMMPEFAFENGSLVDMTLLRNGSSTELDLAYHAVFPICTHVLVTKYNGGIMVNEDGSLFEARFQRGYNASDSIGIMLGSAPDTLANLRCIGYSRLFAPDNANSGCDTFRVIYGADYNPRLPQETSTMSIGEYLQKFGDTFPKSVIDYLERL
ncbi:MAG: NUDIX domain-containing protein [archaeon]